MLLTRAPQGSIISTIWGPIMDRREFLSVLVSGAAAADGRRAGQPGAHVQSRRVKPLAGAVRNTVHIPHMATVTIAFDAANPRKWPLRYHQLYNIASGIMTFVAYDGFA